MCIEYARERLSLMLFEVLLVGLVFNSALKNPSKRTKSRKTVDYNPANSLPMMGVLDIEGNFYGTNSSRENRIRNQGEHNDGF